MAGSGAAVAPARPSRSLKQREVLALEQHPGREAARSVRRTRSCTRTRRALTNRLASIAIGLPSSVSCEPFEPAEPRGLGHRLGEQRGGGRVGGEGRAGLALPARLLSSARKSAIQASIPSSSRRRSNARSPSSAEPVVLAAQLLALLADQRGFEVVSLGGSTGEASSARSSRITAGAVALLAPQLGNERGVAPGHRAALVRGEGTATRPACASAPCERCAPERAFAPAGDERRADEARWRGPSCACAAGGGRSSGARARTGSRPTRAGRRPRCTEARRRRSGSSARSAGSRDQLSEERVGLARPSSRARPTLDQAVARSAARSRGTARARSGTGASTTAARGRRSRSVRMPWWPSRVNLRSRRQMRRRASRIRAPALSNR